MTAHTTGIFPESLKIWMGFVCNLLVYGVDDCAMGTNMDGII
jgi:hypothetical protein